MYDDSKCWTDWLKENNNKKKKHKSFAIFLIALWKIFIIMENFAKNIIQQNVINNYLNLIKENKWNLMQLPTAGSLFQSAILKKLVSFYGWKKRKKQNYYCNNKAAYTVICMQHLKFIFRNCNQCTTRPITSKLKQSSISQTKTKQTTTNLPSVHSTRI